MKDIGGKVSTYSKMYFIYNLNFNKVKFLMIFHFRHLVGARTFQQLSIHYHAHHCIRLILTSVWD